MNCPDCSIPVEKDAKFCPKCYARIEPPGLLRRLADFFTTQTKPGPRIIKSQKTVTFTTVDKDGNRRDYRSLNDVPLAMRSQFEKLESVEIKQQIDRLSSEMVTESAKQPGVVTQRSVALYKIQDASGREHICHSLDELPPEVREAVKRLHAPVTPVAWQDKVIQVRARPVPRYLWTSASIDVYLDGERVFRTGGKIQSIGSHTGIIRAGGSEHPIEVSWGRPRNFCFPYALKIDGKVVMESLVPVENRGLMVIPVVIMAGFLLSLMACFTWLLSLLQHLKGGG